MVDFGMDGVSDALKRKPFVTREECLKLIQSACQMVYEKCGRDHGKAMQALEEQCMKNIHQNNQDLSAALADKLRTLVADIQSGEIHHYTN